MEPDSSNNSNNMHTNDLTALLQNIAFKPDNSEKSVPHQYNDLVNVLISAIAKGGPTSFKIGNQTISINVQDENKQSKSQPVESQQTEEHPAQIENKESSSALNTGNFVEENNQDPIVQEGCITSLNQLQYYQSEPESEYSSEQDASIYSEAYSGKPERRFEEDPIRDKNSIIIDESHKEAQELGAARANYTGRVSLGLSNYSNNSADLSDTLSLKDDKSVEGMTKETTRHIEFDLKLQAKENNEAITKEKNEHKLELTNKQESLVPIKEEEDIDEKETSKQEEKESSIDLEEEKDQIDTNSLLNEISKMPDPNVANKVKLLVNRLKEKEKNLEQREQFLQEQMQCLAEKGSQSSTQLSTDTYSTGFNRNSKELQQILNEVVHDYQGSQASPDSESLGASPSAFNHAYDNNLHFAFMFSEPLVLSYVDSNQNIQKSPILLQVGHYAEQETVKSILRTSKNEIRFRSFAATQAGLGECLNLKPKAIHFCGHGVKNTSENFLFMHNNEGDFLIFEDEEGKADFMSCRALKNLLREKKLEHSIDFVFVASCHSYLVGEVFKEAGAKHVICVGRDEKVLDKACQEFTKHFYQAYFTGNYSVCEAFCNAKEHLKSIRGLPPGEENKFVILYDEDLYESHICSSMFSVSNRSEISGVGFRDLSPIPIFHKIPSRVEHFMGRQIEMHEVIKLIRSQRFVTIKGIPGIGKSSLCKEAANFLLERNVFQNGIIYLALAGCDSIEGIISALDSKLGYLSKDVNSKKESVGNIISQVATFLDQKVKDALIIFDNVDQVHHKERGKLRELLEIILVTCPKVKLLVTSRSPLGGGFQDAAEKVLTLSHLDANNARDLFFSKAPRPIPDSEIKEFLELKLSSSEEAFLPTEGSYLEHFSPSRKGSSGHTSLQQTSFHNQLCVPMKGLSSSTLEGHHFMQILGGHPQAISLAAGLLVERSLKELYKLITSHPILDVLKVEDLTAEEMKSINSMQVSLDVSVNYLKKAHRDAVRFFGLLGLLPGGFQDTDFLIIWGKDWEEQVRLLLRYSLIIKTERSNSLPSTRYLLYPFMIEYAERRLKRNEMLEFTSKVLYYLRDKAEKIYHKIGSVSPDSHVVFDAFLQEETNFKACLKREFETMNRKKGKNTKKIVSEEPEENTFALTKENLKLFDKFHSGKQEWVMKALQQGIESGKAEKSEEEEQKQEVEKPRRHRFPIIDSQPQTDDQIIECSPSQSQESQNADQIDIPPNVQQVNIKVETKRNQEEDTSLISFGERKRAEMMALNEQESEAREGGESDNNRDLSENKTQEDNKEEGIYEIWSAGLKAPLQPPSDDISVSLGDNRELEDSERDKERSITPNSSEFGFVQFHNIRKDAEKYAASSLTSHSASDISQILRPIFQHTKTDRSVTYTGPESIGGYSGNDDASISIEALTPTYSNKTSPHKGKTPDKSSAPSMLSIQAVNDNKSKTGEVGKESEITPRFYSLRESSKESDLGSADHLETKSFDEKQLGEDLLNTLDSTVKNIYQTDLALEKVKMANSQRSQGQKEDNSTIESSEQQKSTSVGFDASLQVERKKSEQTDGNGRGGELPFVETINQIDLQSLGLDIKGKFSEVARILEDDILREVMIDLKSNNNMVTQNSIESSQRESIRKVSQQPKTNEVTTKATTNSPNSQRDTPKTSSFAKKKPLTIAKNTAIAVKAPTEKKLSFLFPGEKKAPMLPACHLMVLYCSILFLLRRFNECEKFIAQGLELCIGYKDKLGEANLLKMKGCINWIKKNFQTSFKDFSEAFDLFQKSGCSLGQATCDAAMGYLKAHMFAEESSANTAIKKLENALGIYKQLNHWFGMHYMHRWLSIVKNKTIAFKSQSKFHSEEARKALNFPNKKKEVSGSRHHAGYFVLRWMGDAFSIFLEVATICDLKPLKKGKDEVSISDTSMLSTNSITTQKPKSRTSFSGLSAGTHQPRTSLQSGKTDDSEDGRSKPKTGRNIQSNQRVSSGKNRSESGGQVPPVTSNIPKKEIPTKYLMPSLRKKKITMSMQQKGKEKERGREEIKEVNEGKEEEKADKVSTDRSQEKPGSGVIGKDGKMIKGETKICIELDDYLEKPGSKGKTQRVTPKAKPSESNKRIEKGSLKVEHGMTNDSGSTNENLSSRNSRMVFSKTKEITSRKPIPASVAQNAKK